MPFILDSALDAALDAVCNPVENLYICSQEPTTYAEAQSTYALGSKATPTIGAAANGVSNGRRRTVAAFTDGSVSATGTATHWALTDNSESVLLATGALSASQAVTDGNAFEIAAFDIAVADAT